jgi:hypothetical protein
MEDRQTGIVRTTIAKPTMCEQAALTGYRHPTYAASFNTFGKPLYLPRTGGWLLARLVRDGLFDLTGPYPLFLANDLSGISQDLAELVEANSFVSVVFVLGPFEEGVEEKLEGFDLVRRYKQHFVARLDRPWESIASAHHRRYVRKSLKHVSVQRVEDPAGYAVQFQKFYRELVERRHISGVAAFSVDVIRAHLSIPGTTVFEASDSGKPLGAAVWYEIDDVAYLHLHAQSEEGIQKHCGFALYSAAIQHFREKTEWISYGGAAGIEEDKENGLYRFKKGWATELRASWLCGKILDKDSYRKLSSRGSGPISPYFPVYRDPRRSPEAAR